MTTESNRSYKWHLGRMKNEKNCAQLCRMCLRDWLLYSNGELNKWRRRIINDIKMDHIREHFQHRQMIIIRCSSIRMKISHFDWAIIIFFLVVQVASGQTIFVLSRIIVISIQFRLTQSPMRRWSTTSLCDKLHTTQFMPTHCRMNYELNSDTRKGLERKTIYSIFACKVATKRLIWKSNPKSLYSLTRSEFRMIAQLSGTKRWSCWFVLDK